MRWAMLAVLALLRLAMAFSLQCVASAEPFLIAGRGVSHVGLSSLLGAVLFAGIDGG